MDEPLITLSRGYENLYEGIAWLYYLLTFVVIFSPFIFVAKKWKPARWWHVTGATVLALSLYLIFPHINDAVVKWQGWGRYVGGADLIVYPLDSINFITFIFVGPVLLSISPFYSVWLIYRKYDWRRWLIALGYSLLTFILISLYIFYFIVLGIPGAFFKALN